MKINIKKLFTKAFKKESDKVIKPLRAWAIGLSVAIVVFCIGIGVTAFDFYTQLVSEPEITAEEKPLVYKQDEVRLHASFYNEREEVFNALRLHKEVPIRETEDDEGSVLQDESEEEDSTDDDTDVTFQ